MRKIILTYNDIYEINQLLERRELRFKVHLHDMCQSQSYTVEPISDCACEGHYEEMKAVVKEYFDNKGIEIRFLESDLEFIIIS